MVTGVQTCALPICELVVVAEGPALTGVYFPGHWHLPEPDAFGESVEATTDPVIHVLAG